MMLPAGLRFLERRAVASSLLLCNFGLLLVSSYCGIRGRTQPEVLLDFISFLFTLSSSSPPVVRPRHLLRHAHPDSSSSESFSLSLPFPLLPPPRLLLSPRRCFPLSAPPNNFRLSTFNNRHFTSPLMARKPKDPSPAGESSAESSTDSNPVQWKFTKMMNMGDLSRDDDYLSHLFVEKVGIVASAPLLVHKMDPTRKLPKTDATLILDIVQRVCPFSLQFILLSTS